MGKNIKSVAENKKKRGWFGHRNDDSTSLGDWFVNEEKITGGLKYLVDEVNKLGLKFGIWMEPEMISPASKPLTPFDLF